MYFVAYNQLPYNHKKDIIFKVIGMITKKLGFDSVHPASSEVGVYDFKYGNLQSSQYKNLEKAIKRTPQEFLKLLIAENNIAKSKKAKK